ncbi:putative protein-like [Planoprotostelium fungivorum]|uniref:Endonuclease/exonuclease/phosphatase domain-containing protein n=1 Tax=Planoprotostelium fungivorum TaxID=1890364 RepID=A0A2P6NIE3_9EUKA|nr:putative protein-like [Planoprotostelium fungivorum]
MKPPLVKHQKEIRQYQVEVEEKKLNNQLKLITSAYHHVEGSIIVSTKRGDNTDNDIRVQTYNIWNWDGNWDVRKLIIAQIVKENNPDIIGWQEIRVRDDIKNEIIQLAELIPGYQYMFVRSMRFPPPSVKHESEGLGLFIRNGIKIHSQDVLRMTHNNCPDQNTRSAVSLTLSINDGVPFKFVDTHWSYDPTCQLSNALEIWKFTKKSRYPLVLLGDLNIFPNNPGPTDMLCGRTEESGEKGDYQDVWDVLHSGEPGITFPSGAKPESPETRCDRIMYRHGGGKNFFTPIEARVVGVEPWYNETAPTRTKPDGPGTWQAYYSSDHHSVVARFNLTRTG